MNQTPRTGNLTVRIFRRGEGPPPQEDWEGTTAEERINAVWELTRLCLAWSGSDEPRLQRSICRVQRTRLEYLVVGAHALAVHGHVRATKDLDVWVRPDPENAKRVLRALVAFGAPTQELTEADLVEPGLIFQIGVSPVRIDIITSIEGVGFDAAWPARVLTKFANQPVSVLSKQHLIQNKRATGRTQDLADLERLEGIEKGDR